MKVSFTPASLGLMVIGAAALIGAAAPVRAEGGTPPSAGLIEGLVVAAADAGAGGPATLTVHPAVGDDLVLTVDPHTHFRKAGGGLDTPDEMRNGLPAVQQPSPTWFVGLFARARFDASHVALDVALTRPEPVQVSGVVDSVDTSASPAHVVLNVPGRGKLDLTVGPHTAVRLDGLPSAPEKLAAGELANALFWLTADENEALRISARMPPPLRFQGVLSGLVTDDTGVVVGLTATRGATTMNFMENAGTEFSRDGKSVPPTDLQNGDYLNVVYRSMGGVNQALSVKAFSPRPVPVPNSGGGDQGANGNPNSSGDQGKPTVTRARALEGQVGSVDATGHTFTLVHEDKTLTFTVDAGTAFRLGDQPAAFADLQAGQTVRVVFRGLAGGNLALLVLIHPANPPAPGGEGGAHP